MHATIRYFENHQEDEMYYWAAIHRLVATPHPDVTDYFLNLCETSNRNEYVLSHALAALARISQTNQHVLDILCLYLESQQQFVRRYTVSALGNHPKAVPLLLTLPVTNPHEQHDLIKALTFRKHPQALPYLINLLSQTTTENQQLCGTIIYCLRSIGTDDAFAVINTWENIYEKSIGA